MKMEERHLAEADRHIAEAERRISEQEQRLDRMKAAGENTGEGERLLTLFRVTLAELQVHRQFILDKLGRA